MLLIAVGITASTTLAGTYIAQRIHRETGPIVLAAGFFLASLLWRRTA